MRRHCVFESFEEQPLLHVMTAGVEESSASLVTVPSTPSQLSSRSPVRLLSRYESPEA